MNEKETQGASCVASLHYESQGLKNKGESNSLFLVLHTSLSEDTVNTVGSHIKRRMA